MTQVPGHLIHIGYAKAGSTFLQRWFQTHPQLAYVKGGLAGFADVYDIARQSAAGRADVKYRVTSAEALATPSEFAGRQGYGAGPSRAADPVAQARTCASLAALFPGAHVLLVTRGFEAALVSGYSQYVRLGGSRDFTTEFGEREVAAVRLEYNYDHLVGLYREAFAGRLILLPFELLRDSPDAFTRALERELGLSHAPVPLDRVNPSLSPAELRWYPRLSRAMLRLPVRGRARRRMLDAYVHRTQRNQLAGLIRLLQAIRPAQPFATDLPNDVLELFRGRAETLRGQPLYAPYEDEYLL